MSELTTLFSLHKKFEPLHERLISGMCLQIDSMNNIYLATQKRIYKVTLKRLIAQQDWIQDIHSLKKLLQLDDSKINYDPISIDPTTQAFNLDKKDRLSQIDFLKFAINEQGIPILMSNLVAHRLRGLNTAELLAFRSFQVHPFRPEVFSFVLNNGDAYCYEPRNENPNKPLSENINVLLGSPPPQITSLLYSDPIVIDGEALCFLVVCAATHIYFLIENKVIEKIELPSEIVHEQIQLFVDSSKDYLLVHCVVSLTDKITSIKLKIQNQVCIERKLSSIEIIGCLGIHSYQNGNKYIAIQQGSILCGAEVENLKNVHQIINFNALSKLVRIINGYYFLQDGQIYHPSGAQRFYQKELYTVYSVATSSSGCLLISAGQPDVAQQKKGSFTIQTFANHNLLILVELFKKLLSNIIVDCLSHVTAFRPLNLDDLVYLMQQKQMDDIYLVRTCFAVMDPKTFASKNQVKIEIEAVNEHQDEANEIGKLFHNDFTKEYCSQVLILNLRLLGKEKKHGWDEIYFASYARYTRLVEENVKIALKTVKLLKPTQQRLEQIYVAVTTQINILATQLQPPHHKPSTLKNEQVRVYADYLNSIKWPEPLPVSPQNCPICRMVLTPQMWTQCGNMHRFLRCGVTQEPLSTQRIIKCGKCKFQFGEIVGLPKQLFCLSEMVCPLCCNNCKYVLPNTP